MKKEAVNTFSEGLNYDFNPTVTPNNVLTDCINGTFLTFNGDELALQNDAGNTQIGEGAKTHIEQTTTLNYGLLYNWYTVVDERHIAASGWTVPSHLDWVDLCTYLEEVPPTNLIWEVVGSKLKAVGSDYWDELNVDSLNTYNYKVVGAGFREGVSGEYAAFRFEAFFHQTDENTTLAPTPEEQHDSVNITASEGQVNLGSIRSNNDGYSVRLYRPATVAELLFNDGTYCADYIGNDGKSYKTIKLNDKVWLAENLSETKYRNSSLIPFISNNTQWTTTTAGAYCYVNGDLNTTGVSITTVVTDTSSTTVKLSEGFYPLGIKEYGGVLYIVSAKEPDIVPTEFDELNTYQKGDIVFTTILNTVYYYESLKNFNTDTLPLESNDSWLCIGLKNDFINKYGFVEFGSYPSPEIIDADVLNNSLDYEVINDEETVADEFKSILYSPQIINNSVFRAGVYVQFTANTASLDTSVVSYQTFTHTLDEIELLSNFKSIYKVRLLHQLTNGFIDLTNDVWQKYAKFYKTSTGFDLNSNILLHGKHFWFTDPNFKYYCPHNFKGKLALSVELEELDTFKLTTAAIEIVNNAYDISFTINYENTSEWNKNITPKTATLVYTTDGSEPDYINSPITTEIVLNNSIPTFTLTLGPVKDYQGAILRYKILPEFYYNSQLINREYLPQRFLDAHTITGSRIIATPTEEVTVRIEEAASLCEIGNTGYRTSQEIAIISGDGLYMDNTGEPTIGDERYLFILDTIAEPTVDKWVAKYTVNTTSGMAVVNEYNPLYPLTYEDYLTSLVNNTQVRVYDPICAYVTLTINLNAAISSTAPIVVAQNGINLPLTKITENQYTCVVYPNVDVTISSRSGFGVLPTTYTEIGGFATDASIDYGLIVDLQISTSIQAIPLSIDMFFVNISSGYFESPIHWQNGACQYTVVQTNSDYNYGMWTPDITAETSSRLFTYEYDNSTRPTYDVTFTSSYANGTFVNLTPGTFKTKDNGLLFLASYNDITTSTF